MLGPMNGIASWIGTFGINMILLDAFNIQFETDNTIRQYKHISIAFRLMINLSIICFSLVLWHSVHLLGSFTMIDRQAVKGINPFFEGKRESEERIMD